MPQVVAGRRFFFKLLDKKRNLFSLRVDKRGKEEVSFGGDDDEDEEEEEEAAVVVSTSTFTWADNGRSDMNDKRDDVGTNNSPKQPSNKTEPR
jgi:hypothetical protein